MHATVHNVARDGGFEAHEDFANIDEHLDGLAGSSTLAGVELLGEGAAGELEKYSCGQDGAESYRSSRAVHNLSVSFFVVRQLA